MLQLSAKRMKNIPLVNLNEPIKELVKNTERLGSFRLTREVFELVFFHNATIISSFFHYPHCLTSHLAGIWLHVYVPVIPSQPGAQAYIPQDKVHPPQVCSVRAWTDEHQTTDNFLRCGNKDEWRLWRENGKHVAVIDTCVVVFCSVAWLLILSENGTHTYYRQCWGLPSPNKLALASDRASLTAEDGRTFASRKANNSVLISPPQNPAGLTGFLRIPAGLALPKFSPELRFEPESSELNAKFGSSSGSVFTCKVSILHLGDG
ncbi:uncharacterized protein LACBIDRAFT_325276 [Laccaria bicolor S238N-H82]|uniref:Predicted protein n=1 Tax=Laccaria bicolor (strain S238N-H82 / ATCC MYA-4686) TaxID=486041 RepID=B0D4E1_LACBS|nr:uncharacterized protein LACBIDRAFT_325276 [Laccaria bicolor S238N-H82]EDR10326.1 predicted protein [Laccaria bicolor S238N-H82]|eukprot:XP_001878776.1 predicted protein [Laccaria bicolor S238N-H82]